MQFYHGKITGEWHLRWKCDMSRKLTNNSGRLLRRCERTRLYRHIPERFKYVRSYQSTETCITYPWRFSFARWTTARDDIMILEDMNSSSTEKQATYLMVEASTGTTMGQPFDKMCNFGGLPGGENMAFMGSISNESSDLIDIRNSRIYRPLRSSQAKTWIIRQNVNLWEMEV